MNLFHTEHCPSCINHKIATFPNLLEVIVHPEKNPVSCAQIAGLIHDRRTKMPEGVTGPTPYCSDCINAAIASADEIIGVLSDATNRATERAWLISLVRRRMTLADEHWAMGLGRPLANVYPEAKTS